MRRPPVLLACHGGSPLSQVTEELAAELERRALVRRFGAAEPSADDELVVLDGCSSACTAQRLAAEGRRYKAAIVLAELGVTTGRLQPHDRERLLVEIARRLERGKSSPVHGRPRRPPSGSQSKTAAHTEEDYLLALDALTAPVASCGSVLAGAPTLAAHVAELLGLTRPSAGEMLARLERGDLVHRGPRKELLLTSRGREAADLALKRQRLLEVFAVSLLGYPLAESWSQARALAASFDDDTVDRLRVALGDPQRCPHGWPVDASRARAEGETLATLDTLADGETAIVARLAENAPSLARLADLGFVPGAQVVARAGLYAAGTRRAVVLGAGECTSVLVKT